MKIAIVAPSPVPFLIGGAEKLFWGLHRQMNQLTPHEVELIKIPCRDQEFWPLMEGYAFCSRLDLSHFDLVITAKYPTWMVSHRNHHLYMVHPCRGVYDLYPVNDASREFFPTHRELEPLCRMLDSPRPSRSLLEPFFAELFRLRNLRDLPSGTFSFPGPLTRAVIRWLDRIALSPDSIKSYSAMSKNVTLREGYLPPGVGVEIIHPPSDLEGFHSNGYDYLFTASRLESLKRVDLLIEAFKSVDADLEFRIAGTGGQEERFKKLASGDSRIRFLGFISDAELIHQYTGALFVPFIPYDEDYGLITVEAMQSSKAVLTTLDAGGVNEFVRDGHNGRAVQPQVEALAEAMKELIFDRERTIQMGRNGKESVSYITWHHLVNGILREGGAEVPRISAKRKKIVGTTTYPIYPPTGGGQKRIYHLYRELARKADCVFLALSGHLDSPRKTLSPGFEEVGIAVSQEQGAQIGRLGSLLKAPIEDIASIDGYRFNPEYLAALSKECSDADLVIASHPYLYRAIREVYSGRLWYEAQNVEYDMKAIVLPASPQRQEYMEQVREVEQQCCHGAELILAVSDEDRDRFMSLYGLDAGKILMVRNGMDFRAASADRLPSEEKRRLKEKLGFGNRPVALFIGSYHGPNIEALKAVKEIALQYPECLFLIVGGVCHHEEAARVPENVKPLGVLEEVEKNVVLNATDVALNPILDGGGSNLKILEYIAYDIPVITTPHGNRGYDLKDKKHLLVADLGNFPDALSDFLRNHPLHFQSMAENARQFAASRYDWSAIAASLVKIIS